MGAVPAIQRQCSVLWIYLAPIWRAADVHDRVRMVHDHGRDGFAEHCLLCVLIRRNSEVTAQNIPRISVCLELYVSIDSAHQSWTAKKESAQSQN